MSFLPAVFAGSSVQVCPTCRAAVDTTQDEPLTPLCCLDCGTEVHPRCRIDQFELLALAGRGGMGVVYKAHDTSLDRHVALKLLRIDHRSDAAFLAQLETEAAITALINHPHVVKVFSTGKDRSRFYIAMEWVDGGSLDERIESHGPIPESQLLAFAIQIAQGLQAAHRHGLIHRDIKPGNLLFGGTETVKIVDFGLAQFIDQTKVTPAEIWATPYYLAPETLEKHREDFRTDIYSFGATLFHALAGRPPFEAETSSLIALQHLKAKPANLQKIAPHVSEPTASIIARTLRKNPADRYQSYAELIQDLVSAHDDLCVGRKPVVLKRRALRTERVARQVRLCAAMVFLILFGLAATALLWESQSSPKKTVAKAAKPIASPEMRHTLPKPPELVVSAPEREFGEIPGLLKQQ